MFLAVVHPEQSLPRLVEVPRLDAEMSALHEHEMEQGRAVASAVPLDSPFNPLKKSNACAALSLASQQPAFEQCPRK